MQNRLRSRKGCCFLLIFETIARRSSDRSSRQQWQIRHSQIESARLLWITACTLVFIIWRQNRQLSYCSAIVGGNRDRESSKPVIEFYLHGQGSGHWMGSWGLIEVLLEKGYDPSSVSLRLLKFLLPHPFPHRSFWFGDISWRSPPLCTVQASSCCQNNMRVVLVPKLLFHQMCYSKINKWKWLYDSYLWVVAVQTLAEETKRGAAFWVATLPSPKNIRHWCLPMQIHQCADCCVVCCHL